MRDEQSENLSVWEQQLEQTKQLISSLHDPLYRDLKVRREMQEKLVVEVSDLRNEVDDLRRENKRLLEIARGFAAEAKDKNPGSITLSVHQSTLARLRKRVELLENVLE